jgi:hypothetical protein
LTTELALNTQMSFDDLAKLTGQDTGGTKDFLPRLRVNKDFETDDGKAIPAGTYAVTYNDKQIYAKTASFRPYMNAYQYQVYDALTNKYTNKTVLFKNFNDEKIDEKGGTSCGKITGKAKDKLTVEQVENQKKIKCYRNLYGTVTMDGVDDEGNDVKIVDYPVLWRSTGSAFMPVGDALEVLTKGKRPFFQAELALAKPAREKNGATIYYVPVVTSDMKVVKPITEEDIGLLKQFQETIDFENAKVIEKYLAAKNKAASDDVIEEINESGFININDFHDDPVDL